MFNKMYLSDFFEFPIFLSELATTLKYMDFKGHLSSVRARKVDYYHFLRWWWVTGKM